LSGEIAFDAIVLARMNLRPRYIKAVLPIWSDGRIGSVLRKPLGDVALSYTHPP
jgi:hypothetical protein